jgi:hypothetical protein
VPRAPKLIKISSSASYAKGTHAPCDGSKAEPRWRRCCVTGAMYRRPRRGPCHLPNAEGPPRRQRRNLLGASPDLPEGGAAAAATTVVLGPNKSAKAYVGASEGSERQRHPESFEVVCPSACSLALLILVTPL